MVKTTPNLKVIAYDERGIQTTWKVSDQYGNLWMNRLRKVLRTAAYVEIPPELRESEEGDSPETPKVEMPANFLEKILADSRKKTEGLKSRNQALDRLSELKDKIRGVAQDGGDETARLVLDFIRDEEERRTESQHRQEVDCVGRY